MGHKPSIGERAPAFGSWIEVKPGEIGKTWVNPFTVVYHIERFGKTLTIWKKYRWDKDSFIWNLLCYFASLFHDPAYQFQKWDDGTDIERPQADITYADIILASPHPSDRKRAGMHYWGVRKGGWFPWYKRQLLWKVFGRPKYHTYVPKPDERVEHIWVRALFRAS